MKFQDTHAPVGSPLNFIQMRAQQVGRGDPNSDYKYIYPFPIEDGQRAQDQEDQRSYTKAE